MKCQILLFLIACSVGTAMRIVITNSFLRDVSISASYFPSDWSSIVFAPEAIPMEGSDEVLIHNDPKDNLEGLIVLQPKGVSAEPITLAWNISTSTKGFGIFSGSEGSLPLADLFTALLNPTPDFNHFYEGDDGWTSIPFPDGSLANVSLIEDGVMLHLKENARSPFGLYYIQAYNTNYYLYRSGYTSTSLEYFSPYDNDDISFTWNITKVDATNFNITPQGYSPLFAFNVNAFDNNAGYVAQPSTGYLWSIQHVEKDIYAIQSERFQTYMDITICRSDNLTSTPTNITSPCTVSSYVGLLHPSDAGDSATKRLWRFIPV